jgi:hypothetical protein
MTDHERRFLLDQLAQMVTNDFGPAGLGRGDSFCCHCVAHRALNMLFDVYEDLGGESPDDIAQRILDQRDGDNPEIENVVRVH